LQDSRRFLKTTYAKHPHVAWQAAAAAAANARTRYALENLPESVMQREKV
jgi:hypothetical protein